MKRIIAISLLLIFISGQLNLTWAEHFCGMIEVKSSLMLGHGHLDCGMGEMTACEDDMENVDGPSFTAPDCCNNDYYSADSDDFFNKVQTASDIQVLFTATCIISLFELNSGNDAHEYFVASSPPKIQPDLQVLFQTFLI